MENTIRKKTKYSIRNEDGMPEGTKPIQNEIEKIEQIAKIQESKIKDYIWKAMILIKIMKEE